MRIQTIVGVALIVVGLLALASGAITYTRREKVIDIGPLEATAERHERIPLPPVLGVVAVAAGVVLLVVAGRRR